MRSVSMSRRLVSIGLHWNVAARTKPVRPIPPAVAQNSSGSTWRDTVTSEPSGRARSRLMRLSNHEPDTWWFLPWMSAATAPPTVT